MMVLMRFAQDVRYALSIFRKQPGFAASAVLTLALGIGATAAIFSVIYSVMLRPLPFADSGRFVHLWSTDAGAVRQSVSYPDFLDWRRQSRTLSRLTAWTEIDGMPIAVGGEAERVEAVAVLGDFFHALGVQPMLGATFPAGDEPSVASVVLSQTYWQRRFGSDPRALERSIVINGTSFRVIGVMPRGFQFPVQRRPIDLWFTVNGMVAADSAFLRRNYRGFEVMGVLVPGATLQQARAEMDVIASSLAARYPEDKGFGVQMIPELEHLAGPVSRPLTLLFVAVGALLLIACVNVANLLLAKAAGRQHEMALRAALGASRGRLWAQLLTESLVLSVAASALGSLLAAYALEFLVALIPGDLPRANEITLDLPVLAFSLVVSVIAGVAFGVAPAWSASRRDLLAGLQEGSRTVSDSSSRRGLRHSLVVAEMALALVLLTGAGLLMNSFWRLVRLNPGIDTTNVVMFMMNVPFNEPARLASFSQQLQEKLQSVPGVRSASVLGARPSVFGTSFDFDGAPQPVDVFTVQPGYMKTLGIPLVAGRDFSAADDEDAPEVVIINQTLANRYFRDENPIGKRLQVRVKMTGRVFPEKQIVGIVGDTRLGTIGGLEREARPQIYFAAPQDPLVLNYFGVLVKADGDPLALVPRLRSAALEVDKETPIDSVITLKEQLGQSIAQDRFNTLLLGIFSGVALILAVIGLYGVMSYTVAQRTNEIGIRVAMGASSRTILTLVMRQGWMLILVGIAVGGTASIALTRLIESVLFGVTSTDPITFALAIAALSLAASLACWIPARRAARVDPILALRCQ
jgi:putative ABC transport system permease protein